ncbi:MAG: cyclic nucleotide-binding domain-containing protein [Candidatus Sericytochromatia bacterium]|nr:cyclic nucleotide-binding domain-containing protein [Candidatus Sericytochromatia bacterium]
MNTRSSPPTAEQDLLDYLLSQARWSEEQLAETQDKWRADRLDLLGSMQGKLVRLNARGQLQFEAFPADKPEILANVPLFKEPPGVRVGQRAIAWLNPENGRHADHFNLPVQTEPGLLISRELTCIWDGAMESAPHLAATLRWTDMAAIDQRAQHADFLAAPAHDLLFVALREAGEVRAYSLRDYAELANWEVRLPGNTKAINLALDKTQDALYMTDNVSGQIWIVDLPDLSHKVYKSGMGILGNLAPAATPGHLFLTVLKPSFSMIYFETERMQATYSVEIKGESWLEQPEHALPQDPICVFDEGSLIILMTALVQGGQPAACINVVDGAEIRTIRRYTVPDNLKPVALARPLDNPYHAWRALDFKTWLEQQQLLKAGEVEAWLQAKAEAAAAAESNGPFRKLPEAKKRDPFHIYQPPKVDPKLWEQVDEAAAEIDLPAGAEDAIVDLINWAFYRLTLTNLLIHADEAKRMRKLAHEIRQQLKTKKVVLAKLDDVLGQHAFETPIDRQSVLELLHQSRMEGRFFRLEELCPMCQTPLEGSSCPACAFALSLPEEQAIDPQHYSAEPVTSLFPGQILLADPERNLLLTLNIWGQPLQEFKGEAAEIKQITGAVALPNRNYLIADALGNRLGEYSPAGDCLWKARLALKKPVMCTFIQVEDEWHYLVVDQGNQRILTLDASGRHHRRYPTLRTAPEDKLQQPVDVQVTPSKSWLISDPGLGCVLETGERGEILQRFGPEQGVSQPIAARRRWDGRTEILDGASQTWLLFAADAAAGDLPEARYTYWPPDVTDAAAWVDKAPPQRASRLHNGEWILSGPDYYLHLAPEFGIVRRLSLLPDPQTQQELLRVSFRSRSGKEVRQRQLAEYAETLQKMALLNEAPEDRLTALAKHVQAVRFSPGQWLLRPGEMGSALFWLIEGELEIIAPEDEHPVIFKVKPGELCGQQAVINAEMDYKPGIRALSESRVLMLERGEFKKAVVSFPRLFQIVREVHQDQLRRFKNFQERKTEDLQDLLRNRMAESRIREFSIFADASPAFIEAISERLHARAYLPDQEVFGRMESGGSLFFVVEGLLGLLRKGETQPSITLEAGQILGEMALLLDQPRSATALTLDYCKFFELELNDAKALWTQYPWFKTRLEALAHERQQTNDKALQDFMKAAGIDRADLPQVFVQPEGLRESGQIYYTHSPEEDVLFGFNSLGEVLWHWGRESERSLDQPAQLHDLGDSLLVLDNGNERILEIDKASREIRRRWRGQLSQPLSACLTPEGFLLVADTGHQRLVVIDESGRELWDYAAPDRAIQDPRFVTVTPENTILFADAGLHMISEISREGKVLWSYGRAGFAGNEPEKLNQPGFALRREDGSTLIADSGNHRLIWSEPDQEPRIIKLGYLEPAFEPGQCQVDLSTGEILVYERSGSRVIKLSWRGELIWQAGFDFSVSTAPVSSAPEVSKDPHWVLDLEALAAASPAPDSAAAESERTKESTEQNPEDAESLLSAWEQHSGESEADPAAQESLLLPEIDAQLDEALQAAAAEDAAKISAPPPAPSFDFLDDDLAAGEVMPETQILPPISPQDAWGALDFLDDGPADEEALPAVSPDTAWQGLDFLNEASETAAPDQEAAAAPETEAQTEAAKAPDAEVLDFLDTPPPKSRSGGTQPLPPLENVLPEDDPLAFLEPSAERPRRGGSQPLPDLDSVLNCDTNSPQSGT